MTTLEEQKRTILLLWENLQDHYSKILQLGPEEQKEQAEPLRTRLKGSVAALIKICRQQIKQGKKTAHIEQQEKQLYRIQAEIANAKNFSELYDLITTLLEIFKKEPINI